MGLRDILYPNAHSLKVLDFTVCLYDESSALPLAGLCQELEAMNISGEEICQHLMLGNSCQLATCQLGRRTRLGISSWLANDMGTDRYTGDGVQAHGIDIFPSCMV